MRAGEILGSNAVIVDTETTGVDATAQVIQLSIIDMQGNTLFDSLFRPSVPIHPMSTKTHGMTARNLIGAPRITELIEQIKELLTGRPVIIYNASFDRRMLRQTLDGFKLDSTWIDTLNYQCAMRIHADYLGKQGNPKLEGGDHTALGDCLAVLSLLRSMTGESNVAVPKLAVQREEKRMLTPSQQAYRTIKKTLLDERSMRERVFKDTKQRDEKTGEIDDALKALDLLGVTIRDLQHGAITQNVTQEKLLG